MTWDWLIRARGLTAGYRGQAVLRDLTFTLPRGTYTALLGANGSGKSTLLKTLLGLLPPILGMIEYGTPTPPATGYVPQQDHLDPNYPLSALDVVLMGAHQRLGPFRSAAKEKELARECLRETDTVDLADKPFSRLSGGQQQRVLIARALAVKPEVLVLDEPTSGVDPSAVGTILELLNRIHRERQLTILLVTHDYGIVRQNADRVAWLHDGTLIEGDPATLMTPEHVTKMLNLA